jgi:hypothetical protein
MHGSARLLWKSTGTGSTNKWGLIRMGDWPAFMLGKTAGAHAKGAAGNITVYTGVEGSEASVGVTVSAWNKFNNLLADKWVIVADIGGRLYLCAGEC